MFDQESSPQSSPWRTLVIGTSGLIVASLISLWISDAVDKQNARIADQRKLTQARSMMTDKQYAQALSVARSVTSESLAYEEAQEIVRTALLATAPSNLAAARAAFKKKDYERAYAIANDVPDGALEYAEASKISVASKQILNARWEKEAGVNKELATREIYRGAKQEQKLWDQLISSYRQLGLQSIDDDMVVRIEWDERRWNHIPFKSKQKIFESFKLMTGKPVRIIGYYSGGTLAQIGIFSDTIE